MNAIIGCCDSDTCEDRDRPGAFVPLFAVENDAGRVRWLCWRCFTVSPLSWSVIRLPLSNDYEPGVIGIRQEDTTAQGCTST